MSDIVQTVCPSTLDEKVQQSHSGAFSENQLLCPSIKKFKSRPKWSSTSTSPKPSFKSICTLVHRYTTRSREISNFPSCNELIFLYTCRRSRPSAREPRRRAGGAWVGVNDSDIITACRLVLFQCPDTDRSSIVPALRGLPRFPCVRNHPPTCCKQTEAGDCETVY